MSGQPPSTPPPFVRQLEERVHDHHRQLGDLRSVVGANHLATLHQVGELARAVARTEALLLKLCAAHGIA